MTKVALITGITGQDGAYLAEFLLAKGCEVHGIKRRTSLFNTERIDHLYQDPHEKDRRFVLHYGDLSDSASITRVMQQIQPDEIYNLGAQSHVAVSFEQPEYTANVDGLGALRILDAIRILGLEKKSRFYQASTSELFGMVRETPQRETTPFYPRSPYGVAKLYAYWITVNYREAYGIFACNGILFNHESPRRDLRGAKSPGPGPHQRAEDCPVLSVPGARLGPCPCVEMQWLMHQQAQPEIRHRHGRAAHGEGVRHRDGARTPHGHHLKGSGANEKCATRTAVASSPGPRYAAVDTCGRSTRARESWLKPRSLWP